LDESYGGLINALDLVITVPQSVMHACGALDVPCWVLTPRAHAWQIGIYPHITHPFYRSLELFWQGEDREWAPVIARAAERLQNFLAAKRRAAA
jgi:hypothetical protein